MGCCIIKRRKIYVHLSDLIEHWDEMKDEIQPQDLFFFGSKRKWVFAETEEDLKESRKNNPIYEKAPSDLK